MAMGKKKRRSQKDLWVATSEIPVPPGHPFYEALEELLKEHHFDDFVEQRCATFYAARMGRPSVEPGVYFRLLLVGYFEGLGSERGIAWRAADSLALREFLGLKLSESPPDHSTLSRTRRLIDVETHGAVFGWVLARVGEAALLKGKTLGIDATTLEANAALRSIVRRDSGEGYEEFLKGLAQASGVETPTRQELVKLDRKRKKKGSNQEWKHPHDPDSRITKMKDGRTHLGYKAEHAVDLETGAIVAVTVQGADQGDTTTMVETLIEAAENIEQVMPEDGEIKEVVADKGYHSTSTMKDFKALDLRSYVSEPDRGRRKWKGDIKGRDAVYVNRRRVRGERGRRLLRMRGERLERPFAHLYRTGGNAADRGQRALERHQTTADSGRGIQSGDGSAEASRCRDSQGPAGPGSSRNVAGFRPLLRHETADGRDGKLLRTVPDTDLFHPSRTGIPFPLKLGTFATGC